MNERTMERPNEKEKGKNAMENARILCALNEMSNSNNNKNSRKVIRTPTVTDRIKWYASILHIVKKHMLCLCT